MSGRTRQEQRQYQHEITVGGSVAALEDGHGIAGGSGCWEILERSGREAWVDECEVVVEGVWEEQETESGTTVATAASQVCLEGGGAVCEPTWLEVAGSGVWVAEEQVVGVDVEVAASRDWFGGTGDCCTSRSSSRGRLKGTGDCGGEQ